MDETLKGYVIESLNEIKKLVLSLDDGGGGQEELFEIQDAIIAECDLTIGELQK